MGRALNRLTVREVATAGAGYHADGGGLYLVVKPTGARSWVYRFEADGRRREMGLGPAVDVTLAEARRKAAAARRQRLDGLDPIDAKRAARSVAGRLWGDACADYITSQAPGWRNAAQAAQWRQSLADHGPPADLPLSRLDTNAVLDCLRRIWVDRTETATRLRGRIERIWDAERVAGNVSGDNPARWRGHLEHLLARPTKVATRSHHAALPYAEAPAFMRLLRAHSAPSSVALEFTILTVARTGEVTGAAWAEFTDDDWMIPGDRMKAGRAHVVPLSRQAKAALERRPRSAAPFGLSENTMLFLLQRPPPRGLGFAGITVHGFRSTFRDWAAETTSTPAEVVEMALAHTIKNKTEAAYRRGDLLAKRRELLQAWADYLDGDFSPQPRTATRFQAGRHARSTP